MPLKNLKKFKLQVMVAKLNLTYTITGEDEFGSQITETITNATGSTVSEINLHLFIV